MCQFMKKHLGFTTHAERTMLLLWVIVEMSNYRKKVFLPRGEEWVAITIVPSS